MDLTEAQGVELVSIARGTLDKLVKKEKVRQPARWSKQYLTEPRGVFVTLSIRENESTELRGCIGFPLPVKALGDAVVEATVEAAVHDPRFPPVSATETGRIIVEVSVLTDPEMLEPKNPMELAKLVRIGKDGLIVDAGYTSGLLLPQVPVEFGWGPEEFLSQACVKAGLLPDAWLTREVKLSRFQAEIFSEVEPRGTAKRIEL
jgi:uncharacterized protein (TIGR00296 family)